MGEDERRKGSVGMKEREISKAERLKKRVKRKNTLKDKRIRYRRSLGLLI